jgi:hypothetical protein
MVRLNLGNTYLSGRSLQQYGPSSLAIAEDGDSYGECLSDHHIAEFIWQRAWR